MTARRDAPGGGGGTPPDGPAAGPAGDGPGGAGSPRGGRDDEAVDTRPIGTLFLLMLYIMVLAGMWVTMYWLMVVR